MSDLLERAREWIRRELDEEDSCPDCRNESYLVHGPTCPTAALIADLEQAVHDANELRRIGAEISRLALQFEKRYIHPTTEPHP